MAPNFLEIVGFWELLMFRWKIVGLFLLAKINKGYEFYRKIFELDPPTL